MPSAYHYPPNAPQSMTMQMALDDDTPLPPIRPHHTPELPLSTSQLPSKPPRPIRKDSASTSPTPTDQNDKVQCAAMTKAKKRCTRFVKTQAMGDNQDQDSPDLPRYCYQHKKEVLQNDKVQCAAMTKAEKRCTRFVKAQAMGDNQDQNSPDLPRYCYQHKKKVLQNDQFQCAATTQAEKRCIRIVKTGAALAQATGDNQDQDSPDLPRYCWQHKKKVLQPGGYYSKKNGEWVKFDDWIPQYLQAETRAALRDEMQKSRSSSDVPGYIYTFEIREPSQNKTIKLKVGQTVNLGKRIDQWGRQCSSKEQILRGFYPRVVESDEDGGEGSLMKGQVKAGEKAAWCHRLERLIHLELADLVATCVYLDPEWLNVDCSSNEDTATRKKSKQKKNSNARPCPDCRSVHKEIFEFERWKRGKNTGKEWELVVKPVVERWGKFVELYV
ncbi:uncharacterized protein LACBIDRAFT_316008 [Laccaria bicolor S238N-H82]|uniref:Predicted protein n=1 Tax=Laccaria bicolor (strain S238N-H82 / ATCC MYA-4686) TaxID=486041 RepID=B0D3Q0_LACBS|nr:uncharacterized protein LACBIDRAFT_316008 [Laccaria bicolor S238N-H82]EDR10966.1 predicted protein [Laccaria bicolor S238N-H82]|eukprot:XP_001878267.1 predicted protein [Laccaria bicolor S238N-H82]